MEVKKISENKFDEEVIKSNVPVIVDFYADWCGPCKMMSAILDTLTDEIGDTAKIVKVNTDENLNLAMQYKIMSIPTIMIFKDGQLKETFVGVTDKNKILNVIRVG